MQTEPQVAEDKEPSGYEPPRLTYVGQVSELVQSGNGKATINYPDGPDTRKPPGH